MTTAMPPVRLRNSMTRKIEDLTPVTPGKVGMYLCGPTVYDRAHLGNARNVILFDVLFRLFREIYGPENVTYVRNFTDVDDNINARAAKTGRDIAQITEETIQWYLDDMGALGALEPTHMPRATAYIAQMVAMIEVLIAKGHAYPAEGHVLFRVSSYTDYGKLSGRSVDDMIAGARVEVAPYKDDPMDFVLWKPSDAETPGWDSPWGRGRPGWHIECSAMAHELLGETFDIHGGGNDLIFPHHENEIAQSCCAHPGGGFANIWLHNEMLLVEGKKMSKSLGNFFTVRDLLDQGVPGEVIRFVFLSTHYSKPMDWTEKKAAEAKAKLQKWAIECRGVEALGVDSGVLRDLCNDVNTASSLGRLDELFKVGDRETLLASANLLGLDLHSIAERDWAKLFSISLDKNGEFLEGKDYQPSVGVAHWGSRALEVQRAANSLGLLWQSKRRNAEWNVADELKNAASELGVRLDANRSEHGTNSVTVWIEEDPSVVDLTSLVSRFSNNA